MMRVCVSMRTPFHGGCLMNGMQYGSIQMDLKKKLVFTGKFFQNAHLKWTRITILIKHIKILFYKGTILSLFIFLSYSHSYFLFPPLASLRSPFPFGWLDRVAYIRKLNVLFYYRLFGVFKFIYCDIFFFPCHLVRNNV